MPKWKLLLFIPALLLVAAANLRTVCTVRVDGVPVEGSWSPRGIERAEALALGMAEEVARGGTALPDIEVSRSLSVLPASGDERELAEAILCSCQGVQRAWALSVDGEFLGWAEDISALSETMEGVIGVQIPVTAIRAGFDAEISIEPAAIPEGWQTDVDTLSRRLHELARVFYVTPDGAMRYA